MNREAIEAIRQTEATDSVAEALADALNDPDRYGILAAPADFTLHDVQKYLPNARRMTGVFRTTSIGSFAKYVKASSQVKNCRVYIDAQNTRATAILNAGSPMSPGHRDHMAVIALERTPAYADLLRHADGSLLTQRTMAELLEDWIEHWHPVDEEGNTPAITTVIAAVRDLSVDSARKLEQKEGALSASRSTFESVTASSKHALPQALEFECRPHDGFVLRQFRVRLRVRASSDGIMFKLDLANQEQLDEKIGMEFADKVGDALAPENYLIVLGTFGA